LNKLAVVVTTPPYSNLTVTAIEYIETALQLGINVVGVFFYQDGVLHANKNISIANDEYQSLKHWKALHQKYNVPLYMCITAAEKRGVISDSAIESSLEENITITNEIFIVSGLGELVSLVDKSTRTVQF